MKEIHGKKVFDSLEEIIDLKHSAILIVDVQNDLFSEGGHFHRLQKDISMMREILPRLVGFIQEARKFGVLRIFIQQTTLKSGLSDSPAWLYFRTRAHRISPDFTIDGTWGHEIVSDFSLRDDEPVVKKHRSSAFVNTSLDLLLRNNGIKSVIITGAVTEGCVLATAIDALFYDYYVVVVKDCIASRNREVHEACLKVIEARHDLVTSGEILKIWTSGLRTY